MQAEAYVHVTDRDWRQLLQKYCHSIQYNTRVMYAVILQYQNNLSATSISDSGYNLIVSILWKSIAKNKHIYCCQGLRI